MGSHYFYGVKNLIFFILKQQRLKILLWIIGLTLVTLSVAMAYPDLYGDDQAKQAFAYTMENPAMVAMRKGFHCEGESFPI